MFVQLIYLLLVHSQLKTKFYRTLWRIHVVCFLPKLLCKLHATHHPAHTKQRGKVSLFIWPVLTGSVGGVAKDVPSLTGRAPEAVEAQSMAGELVCVCLLGVCQVLRVWQTMREKDSSLDRRCLQNPGRQGRHIAWASGRDGRGWGWQRVS